MITCPRCGAQNGQRKANPLKCTRCWYRFDSGRSVEGHAGDGTGVIGSGIPGQSVVSSVGVMTDGPTDRKQVSSPAAPKFDMQSLRDICAGNIPKAEEAPPVPVAAPLCPRQGTDERGDRYRCRLPKGHRGQCQPGERIE